MEEVAGGKRELCRVWGGRGMLGKRQVRAVLSELSS